MFCQDGKKSEWLRRVTVIAAKRVHLPANMTEPSAAFVLYGNHLYKREHRTSDQHLKRVTAIKVTAIVVLFSP